MMDGCSNLNKKNQSFQDYEDSNSLWILILEFLEAIDKSCEIFKKSYIPFYFKENNRLLVARFS